MKLNYQKYCFRTDESAIFKETFQKVAVNVFLENIENRHLNEAICKSLGIEDCDLTGVYFWVMNMDGIGYKIYAGKTKSLKRRLSDYTNPFQIHSPNDYKLQFFQTFILKHFPEATFDLYFMKCNMHDYTSKETEVVNTFKPLVNERAKVSLEAKEKMKAAFANYYNSVFIEKSNA